ncbi:MAG: hypothetical protein HZA17_10560, partial [Nitrospirae bacterium]|nr:hypothetical protein [Nitrospirota bacterium]
KLKTWNKKLNVTLSIPTNSDIRATINAISSTGAPGVNIAGYITSESGTGEAVRSDIRMFEAMNIPYVLNRLSSTSRQDDNTHTLFSDTNPHPINLIHVNADQVPVFYDQKGADYFRNKYNIGYWVWELSEFPEDWHPHFRYFNEIWTASSFCLDTLAAV